jgi:hypothetical protein
MIRSKTRVAWLRSFVENEAVVVEKSITDSSEIWWRWGCAIYYFDFRLFMYENLRGSYFLIFIAIKSARKVAGLQNRKREERSVAAPSKWVWRESNAGSCTRFAQISGLDGCARVSCPLGRSINKSRDLLCFLKMGIPPAIPFPKGDLKIFHRPRILFNDGNRVCVNTRSVYMLVDFHICSEECGVIVKEIRIST